MTDSPSTPQDAPGRSGMSRLRRSFFRASRGQAVVGTLVGVLAFAAVTQVRVAGQDDPYANLRESDLIQTLNGLQAATRKSERAGSAFRKNGSCALPR